MNDHKFSNDDLNTSERMMSSDVLPSSSAKALAENATEAAEYTPFHPILCVPSAEDTPLLLRLYLPSVLALLAVERFWELALFYHEHFWDLVLFVVERFWDLVLFVVERFWDLVLFYHEHFWDLVLFEDLVLFGILVLFGVALYFIGRGPLEESERK
jgi:hypothetical protein